MRQFFLQSLAIMHSTLRNDSLEKKGSLADLPETQVEHGRISQSDAISNANDEKAIAAARREWAKTSPDSPRNWPAWKKWWIVLGLNFYTVIVFIVADGFVTNEAEAQYGVGEEVSILGQSMFILGVAIGVGQSPYPCYEQADPNQVPQPMFLAPLSEIYGRQPIYTTGILLFAILQIPTALSPTFAGVAIAKFLTGCVAGIPISNVGATAADLYPTSHTAWPIMLFSFTSQALGPDLGPVIGSAFYVTTGSIHWLYWLTLILGMITFVWSLTFGETLHDKLYERQTGVKKNKSSVATYVTKELFRAFRMLFTEPIVIAMALTTTYLFGLIFIYLEGYPLVYEDGYDFNPTQEGATFLVGIGGGLLALATQPLQNYMYRRSALSTSDGRPRPEACLYTACFAVWCLPASIFWFAFTSTDPSVSYQVPMWSGFLFGYAEVATYAGVWQYVTDAYGESAGSALAACNLPANGISAGLAHLAVPMFDNEGTKWALATLAFISLGFLAVPPLIILKGPELRRRSRFASDGGPADDD